MSIESEIKAFCQNLGFLDCKITSAKPFNDLVPILEKRKQENRLADFEESEFDLRINPLKSMPSVQSIIAVAFTYDDFNISNYIKQAGSQGISSKGQLASYCQGLDYHLRFQALVDLLITYLATKGIHSIPMCDTGPLMDRAVGARAGLGFIGKNCSLITKAGSFVAIGEILVDRPLQVDEPIAFGCDSCQICLKACPTHALEEAFQMNPKLCLSQITQTKQFIPYELRVKLGTRLFGCDTCQKVCPYNQGYLEEQRRKTPQQHKTNKFQLIDILMMDKKDFKLYGNRAFSWRGINILKRNAMLVGANLKDKNLGPYIVPYLKSNSTMLRGYGVYALGMIDYEKYQGEIEELLAVETDDFVMKEIQWIKKK
jgi:epoxyqueuosine reductase